MPIINGHYVPPSHLSIGELEALFGSTPPPSGVQEVVKTWNQAVFNSKGMPIEKAFLKKPRRVLRKYEDEMSIVLDARKDFTFGCDPELFVFNDKGVAVPADMIPGTKAKPHPVKGGAVQRDGFAAEFNIEPVTTFKEFNQNIETVMAELKTFLPKGYELRAIPSVTFEKEIFDAATEDVKELGCSPDYNAWEGKVNPPPKHPTNPYLRTASGHLHLGWTSGASIADPQHVLNCTDMVKQLDWYLGGWSVRIDPDKERRSLYGKAGACRFKDYGVEYRVLSNFWITSRERRLAVWNRMQQAINTMAKGFLPDIGDNGSLIKGIDNSSFDKDFIEVWRNPLLSLQLPALPR